MTVSRYVGQAQNILIHDSNTTSAASSSWSHCLWST